jgi:KUP system potassium uptake protein
VFPALTLSYLGQASLIERIPSKSANAFFHLIPGWGQLPMVFLATVATVIASQSVISGAFSVTRQVIQLGFLPRMSIRHTSEREAGQIYVPGVNWFLYLAVVALVLGFGSSARLAFAYGLAVTGTFLLNTTLFLAVARLRWKEPTWKIVAGALGFGILELAFLAANLTKLLSGAWLPLVVGLAVFTVLETWQVGRRIVTRNRTEEEGPLRGFVEQLHNGAEPVYRVPGTAIFLNPTKRTTPLAMRANVEHNHALHEHVVILSIDTKRVPYVPQDERVAIDDLGHSDDGIVHVTTRFGYAEEQNVPAALRYACERELSEELKDLSLLDATYFVSRITIVRTDAPGLARWRKRLFVAIAKNAASPVDYFGLPIDRTVTMGSAIRV